MTLGPLIVQSDHTVLLEVAHLDAEDARHALAVFAELERAPEHIHTYRITRLGLWNARAAGHTSEEILETLNRYAKFPVPSGVAKFFRVSANGMAIGMCEIPKTTNRVASVFRTSSSYARAYVGPPR